MPIIDDQRHSAFLRTPRVEGGRCSNIKVSKLQRRSDVDVELGDDIKYTFVEDGHRFLTDGATLKAIHTPGHTDDHLVLMLEEENALFSGDCVLGEGTCVFEDLYDYMKSLDAILAINPSVIHPAHGPVIHDPVTHVNDYISHRNQREAQILETLLENASTYLTALDVVKRVYKGVPEYLFIAAAQNVTLHLGKLLKEKKVEVNKEGGEVSWKVTPAGRHSHL
ncbi:Endoribonuclease LACTB2 [Lamellibrachia satsuma]|nr:Endoribonuclease LACTB2 [Lamellibrachia satsuma]